MTTANFPTRTGANLSSISDTFPYSNVKDYGAKGDGSTDDTASIQNAVNAMVTANSHLYFPAGNYKITSAITIGFGTGFIIEGTSMGSTFITQYTDNTPIFNFTASETHGFLIKNFDFEYKNYQPVTNTNSVAIYFSASVSNDGSGFYNFTIDSCTFNSGYYGIKQISTSSGSYNVPLWGIWISHCVFGGTLSGGAIYIAPYTSVGQPEVVIENTYIHCSNDSTYRMYKNPIYITCTSSCLLKGVEFNQGIYSGGTMTTGGNTNCQIYIVSSRATLINCRSEGATVIGATAQALWWFNDCKVSLIGCEITGVSVPANGTFVFADGQNYGHLSVNNLIASASLGSGAIATAVRAQYLASVQLLSVDTGILRYPANGLPNMDLDLYKYNGTLV